MSIDVEKQLDAKANGELPTAITEEPRASDAALEKPPPLEKDEADGKATDGAKEKEKTGNMKDFFRIFAYADRQERILYSIALFASIASGAALPLMTIIFGQFTGKFNDFATGKVSPEAFKKNVDHFTLWFIYLFVGRVVVAYVGNSCISVAAVRTTGNLRKAFMEKTLRQEIWHFDKAGNGSTASQVTTSAFMLQSFMEHELTESIRRQSH